MLKQALTLFFLATVVMSVVLWFLITWFLHDSDFISDLSGVQTMEYMSKESASNDSGLVVLGRNQPVIAQERTSSQDADELPGQGNARRQRHAELALTPVKAPDPIIPVDISLHMPDICKNSALARVPVSLKFRPNSSIIKGESLNALASMVALYRECGQGEFVVAENPLGSVGATQMLSSMRFDEVKYFFIQHSVALEFVIFPEEQPEDQ